MQQRRESLSEFAELKKEQDDQDQLEIEAGKTLEQDCRTTTEADAGGGNPTNEVVAADPLEDQQKQIVDESAPMKSLYVVSAAYLAFTLTDGALRVVVLLHANHMGFGAFDIAMMFLLYEFLGMFANVFAGLFGGRFGLRPVLLSGLMLQVVCLIALSQVRLDTWDRWMSIGFVVMLQALAGVAKDFVKLPGKSIVKCVSSDEKKGQLFKLTVYVTGSKNAVKGLGHLLGGILVGSLSFQWAMLSMAFVLLAVLPLPVLYLDNRSGRSRLRKKRLKPEKGWHKLFVDDKKEVNRLAQARCLLFGSRDAWFEIGLPLYLRNTLGWHRELVGLAMGGYIVVYGMMQSSAKMVLHPMGCAPPSARHLTAWTSACIAVPIFMGVALLTQNDQVEDGGDSTALTILLITGVVIYALIFAINSSVHSYLILRMADKKSVARTVGVYYMANAGGRLIGTMVGGVLMELLPFHWSMWVSAVFLVGAAMLSDTLPDSIAKQNEPRPVEDVELQFPADATVMVHLPPLAAPSAATITEARLA